MKNIFIFSVFMMLMHSINIKNIIAKSPSCPNLGYTKIYYSTGLSPNACTLNPVYLKIPAGKIVWESICVKREDEILNFHIISNKKNNIILVHEEVGCSSSISVSYCTSLPCNLKCSRQENNDALKSIGLEKIYSGSRKETFDGILYEIDQNIDILDGKNKPKEFKTVWKIVNQENCTLK